ncbi:MAG: hypothetical protein GY786_16220 [Proteobacteria bacterium]|nr:hypothetical protein [Pseudomonadota bacterium]
MKHNILLLLLLLLLAVSFPVMAEQLLYTGTDIDGSYIDARNDYLDTASKVAADVSHFDFKSRDFRATYVSERRPTRRTSEAISQGIRWYSPGAFISTHRNSRWWSLGRSLTAHSNNDDWLNPNGYTLEVEDISTKMYGVCASFFASVWGAKLEFIPDGDISRAADFDGKSKLYNSNYPVDGVVYPYTTLCFIDTEGFQELRIQTVQKDPNDDEVYLYETVQVDVIGPLDYMPDFTSILGQPADQEVALPQGECGPNEIMDWEGECQDDPSYVEPEEEEEEE